MVWLVADMKADFQRIHAELNTRVSLIENNDKAQQDYLTDLKADLKEDIEKNNKKLNDIYNLLLKR